MFPSDNDTLQDVARSRKHVISHVPELTPDQALEQMPLYAQRLAQARADLAYVEELALQARVYWPVGESVALATEAKARKRRA